MVDGVSGCTSLFFFFLSSSRRERRKHGWCLPSRLSPFLSVCLEFAVFDLNDVAFTSDFEELVCKKNLLNHSVMFCAL